MGKQPQSGNANRLQLWLPLSLLIAAVALIAAMRSYDSWPAKPAPCVLRSLTGIPCLSCGATRSLRSLSEGKIGTALHFNPLVVVAIGAIPFWLALAIFRNARGREKNSRKGRVKVRWIVAGAVFLVMANWIYLILFLPE